MARQIQIRRGTAAEHINFTGAIGEITMDTTNNTLRIHDGQTVGGTMLAKKSEISHIWISDNYDLSTTANVVISHNLNLENPAYAMAIPYLRVMAVNNGYSVGDMIANFQLCGTAYTPNGICAASGFGNMLNISEMTVKIPRIFGENGIYLFNKGTGAQVLANKTNFKVFVKIIY